MDHPTPVNSTCHRAAMDLQKIILTPLSSKDAARISSEALACVWHFNSARCTVTHGLTRRGHSHTGSTDTFDPSEL